MSKIFSRKDSFFQVQEIFRVRMKSSSYFIVGNSHMKIISSHTVVFNKNAILRFSDIFHLLKLSPKKVPQK